MNKIIAFIYEIDLILIKKIPSYCLQQWFLAKYFVYFFPKRKETFKEHHKTQVNLGPLQTLVMKIYRK